MKLGYAKQFLKKLNVEGEPFKYLKQVAFPKLSDENLKLVPYKCVFVTIGRQIISLFSNSGILIGPQIRQLIRDEEFSNKLSNVERRAWNSFISLCKNFLGNNKSPDYVAVVAEFLKAYEEMDCNMSIKIHFLHSHLEFFPENLGKLSDEQGERFHKELWEIEKRFQGKSSVNMMSEYCWSVKRNESDFELKRKRTREFF
mgnify:CR=1 FL=1